MKFNTVLYNVKSPKNVGMIVRSHVAFGGDKFIFVGYEKPWDFKKGSQAFSRKLESKLEILFFSTIDSFFEWSNEKNLKNIAVEFDTEAIDIESVSTDKDINLIVGNEVEGVPKSIIEKVDKIVVIEQFGNVGSLNVAVSASIIQHSLGKNTNKKQIEILGSKFIGEHDINN